MKKRYWAFVLYPESAPENWKEILQQTGLSICVSPLHDKDINPTGEPKKAHYHIILCYSGPTTFKCVKSITDSLNQPIPIALEQVRGYFRYLTHKDNPEKYQYNEKDITTINDFDIDNYNDLSISQIKTIMIDIQKIIRDNDILEYCDLLDFLLDSELFSYLDVAQNHTILFNTYITSLRNKKKNIAKNNILC
jgi:hypothetical protein